MNKTLEKVKNLNAYKKFMAMLTAGVMFTTPVAGLSENYESDNTNESAFELVMQKKAIAPMTFEEYKLLVSNAADYLVNKLPNTDRDAFMQSLECLCYDVNIDFVDDESEFVNSGIVFGEDAQNGRLENMIVADTLIRDIQDYNQSVIKGLVDVFALRRLNFANYDKQLFHEYLMKVRIDSNYNFANAVADYNKKVEKSNPDKVIEIDGIFCQTEKEIFSKYLAGVITDDDYDLSVVIDEFIKASVKDICERLINPSVFCYSEDDKSILNQIFEDWFFGYFPVAMGTSLINNENYDKAYKQLATLGSEEKLSNVNEASTGAEHIAQKILGVGLINTQYDYMQTYYEEERKTYYDTEKLNRGIWVLREDVSLNPNCMTELEVIIFQNGMIKVPAIEVVNNKLMSVLFGLCNTNSK